MPLSVEKKNGENSLSLVNRFSRKIKKSGLIYEALGRRYHKRSQSQVLKKRTALKKQEAREKYRRLRKLGKI
jgi:hypothetical protein